MPKYNSFWQKIVNKVKDELDPNQVYQNSSTSNELVELGNRQKYDGYIDVFAFKVRNRTDSQVFVDLHTVLEGEKKWCKTLGGQLEIRIRKNSEISINYQPFSWELIMTRYQKNQNKTQMAEELYKWELVKGFQNRWQDYAIGTISFQHLLRETDWNNLAYNLFIPNFKKIIDGKPNELEAAFIRLYNEELGFQNRIDSFQTELNHLYAEVKTKESDQLFLSEREIGTFLTFRYPEKYTFYMWTFYDPLHKLLGRKGCRKWYQLVDYYEIVNDFKENVLPNYKDAIEVKNALTAEEKYYSDINHLLIIQDIFYMTLMQNSLGKLDVMDQEKYNDEIKEINEQSMQHSKKTTEPLNQILFGPPGTGKTYNTIDLAVKIAMPDGYIDDHKQNKIIFDELVENNQIAFTTFHQSMSYEDFVEGIKPVLNDDSKSQDIGYEITPGIFKTICNNARKVKSVSAEIDWQKVNFFKMSIGGLMRKDIHSWCIDNNMIALGYGGDHDLSEFRRYKSWTQYRDKFSSSFPSLIEQTRYHAQSTYAFIQSMNIGDVVVITKGNYEIDAIGQVIGDYEFKDDAQIDFYHFRKVKWLAVNMGSSPSKFFKKQISQQTIYEFSKRDIKFEAFNELTHSNDQVDFDRPYILIIDEINRGNVSSIFGELITLIEPDKRKDQPNALSAILPYSKEPFSVPSNLYIIGTMNTADRSVEALDSALRRRFSFKEMPPVYDLEELDFEVSGYKLNKYLRVINNRIEKLLDKDHQIGHAYFLQVKNENDFKVMLRDKIIPLLQEYFFGDFGKIGLVLGASFIDVESDKFDGFAGFEYEDASALMDYSNRRVYRISNPKNWNFGAIVKPQEAS